MDGRVASLSPSPVVRKVDGLALIRRRSAPSPALPRHAADECGVPKVGLASEIPPLRGREQIPEEEKRAGGSHDIGDISWHVSTVSLSFPANFQAGPGHSWASAIAMATPIAHEGVVAGAQVQAMTVLDVLMRPEVVEQASDYFRNVQTKETTTRPSFVRRIRCVAANLR